MRAGGLASAAALSLVARRAADRTAGAAPPVAAGQMLDSIGLTSVEQPPCVNSEQLPDKVPVAIPPVLTPNPLIDAYLRALPERKRWLIGLTTSLSAWYTFDPKLVDATQNLCGGGGALRRAGPNRKGKPSLVSPDLS